MAREYISRSLVVQVDKKRRGSPTVIEDEYLVPTGIEVVIERFLGGREASETEVRTELLVKDGNTETVLFVGYDLNYDIRDVGLVIGNGTKKIIIRHVNGDNGELHMTGLWKGAYNG